MSEAPATIEELRERISEKWPWGDIGTGGKAPNGKSYDQLTSSGFRAEGAPFDFHLSKADAIRSFWILFERYSENAVKIWWRMKPEIRGRGLQDPKYTVWARCRAVYPERVHERARTAQ